MHRTGSRIELEKLEARSKKEVLPLSEIEKLNKMPKLVADLAEKCRLNNKKDAKGGAIENLRSCYLARGGSLSASIRVDAASAVGSPRGRRGDVAMTLR